MVKLFINADALLRPDDLLDSVALTFDTHIPAVDATALTDSSWRTVFDGDPARVLIVDGDGSIAGVNRAWRAHNGEDNGGAAWSGSNYFDLLVKVGAPVSLRIAAAISEVLDGVRDEFSIDYACHESTTGRATALRAYAWTRQGRRWAIVRHVDATALGDAREQAALLHCVLSDLAAPVIVCDLAHRVIQWNAGAQELYGYTLEQARGMRLEHLISPHGDPDELGLTHLDPTGRATATSVHRCRDGSMVTVDVRVRLLPDRDGRPGFYVVAADAAGDRL